jgi:acyl-CoA thioester hydrolase
MLIHKTNLRVRYAETDQMQYAYYGNYLEYFEVGRAEMMRERGLTYKQIEENGYHMPVAEAFVKYKSPAFYDELLEIETKVELLPKLKVHIDHQIKSAERDVLIAEGYVELVFIIKETKKITRPPKFFVDAIKIHFNKD